MLGVSACGEDRKAKIIHIVKVVFSSSVHYFFPEQRVKVKKCINNLETLNQSIYNNLEDIANLS